MAARRQIRGADEGLTARRSKRGFKDPRILGKKPKARSSPWSRAKRTPPSTGFSTPRRTAMSVLKWKRGLRRSEEKTEKCQPYIKGLALKWCPSSLKYFQARKFKEGKSGRIWEGTSNRKRERASAPRERDEGRQDRREAHRLQ